MKILIKNLSKQLETLTFTAILKDKTKNKIIDEEIKGTKKNKKKLQKIKQLDWVVPH